MSVKQLSVFVENKFGRLSDVTELLSENNIDISALSMAETQDYGILRMIVDNPRLAAKILSENGIIVKATDVIAIAVDDKSGGLNAALQVMKNAGISVEYMYAFVGKSKGQALVVLKVSNCEKAIEAFNSENIKLIPESEIYSI